MNSTKPICALVLPLVIFADQAMSQTAEEFLQIDEGFQIFTEETFDGNGRTCSTCHIPDRNYTVAPDDIPELDDEHVDLLLATNVPGLENTALVMDRALFNIGPGDATVALPEGPFRGSMTVAALESTSVMVFPFPQPPQFGWAGDGSPSGQFHHGNIDLDADGSIRAFANGAIAQHAPLTLNRVAGTDFRFATADELDALDAFQKWLGRRPVVKDDPATDRFHELELDLMSFVDPDVDEGREMFIGNEATCDACHVNGGGHLTPPPPIFPPGTVVPGLNANLNTNAAAIDEEISAESGVEMPEDEGGITVVGAPFGFNIQSIIEAPRKKAFFHNSAELDLEDSIRFYFTEDFANSIARTRLGPHTDDLDDFLAANGDDAIEKIGAFMRALSVYYALRDCERLMQESIDRLNVGVSPGLPADHCKFNLADSEEVLLGSKLKGKLYNSVRVRAGNIQKRIDDAVSKEKINKFENIIADLEVMRDDIASSPEADR